MRFIKRTVFVTLALLSCVAQAAAADKALIIGVGKYAIPDANLPGIDLDVSLFKQTVQKLGVKNSNIKILMDSQATKANVVRQMKLFFNDVGRRDNVFIYFSGHGSQLKDKNGDESDGLDEFLVMHDFTPRNVIQGALTDDEINKLIKGIGSDNVYVFVDACHSGTVTKGLNLLSMNNRSLGEARSYEKFWSYSGMPTTESAKTRGVGIEVTKGSNFVAVTATQDDELALATEKGSLFTLGLHSAVSNALNGKGSITPEQIVEQTTRFIHANTTTQNRYTPSINGNRALFSQRIETRRTGQSGQNWGQMTALAAKYGNLTITSDRKQYALGDTIQFSFTAPIDGYLNIINVDEHDNATVIFPNRIRRSNQIKEGTLFSSDPDSLGFRFFASEPLGKSLTVAVITKEELDLYSKTSEGRDVNGNITATLVPMSADAAQAVGVEAVKPGTYTGAVITTTGKPKFNTFSLRLSTPSTAESRTIPPVIRAAFN